ncbi:MAG: RNA 2',3'-cyclic phosphodiesterase [Verrucomicrobiales bacterium]|nr:RNA 2',3'-cyclic phosphodiesterase [Verrucomicrobiales bacterium]
MKSRRLFVALWPPENVVRSVVQVRDDLKQRLPHGVARFVPNHQIHLTMEFLGEVPEDRIPNIWAAVVARLGTPPEFTVRLGLPGTFPGSGRPRILWLGLNGDTSRVERLRADIVDVWTPFKDGADPPEKAFHPHLTLARFREMRRNDADRILEVVESYRGNQVPDTAWVVRGIRLMRSELGPAGPNYSVEAVMPFALTAKPGEAAVG